MDNNNKEVTQRKFKVGDTVWDCTRGGKGKVSGITDGVFSVCVVFEDGAIETYNSEGYFDSDYVLPSLYHQPYRIELLDIPEELPEVGTIVYVWDDGAKTCHPASFIGKSEDLRYLVTATLPVKDGNITYWDNFSLTLPEQFK